MKNLSKKYIQKLYIFWAKIYDTVIDRMFSFDRRAVIDKLRILKKEKILEVGVGTGLNLPYYPAESKVVGVDFSSAMTSQIKTKKNSVDFSLKICDARSMPFSDNHFDKALATYVLRVSPEPWLVMKEVSRVLKKDTLFIVLDQFRENSSFFSRAFEPVKIFFGWGKEYSISDLTKGNSFEVVESTNFGLMRNTKLVVFKNGKK